MSIWAEKKSCLLACLLTLGCAPSEQTAVVAASGNGNPSPIPQVEEPNRIGPIGRLRKRALQAAGRQYSTNNYIGIDIKPLADYRKAIWRDLRLITDIVEGNYEKHWLGLAILDYDDSPITVGQNSSLQVTIISRGYHLGYNLGGRVNKINCDGTRCGSFPTFLDIEFPPNPRQDYYAYKIEGNTGTVLNKKRWSVQLPEMPAREVATYEFSFAPKTIYQQNFKKFPVSVKIHRGGLVAEVFSRKFTIKAEEGIGESKLGEHFRLTSWQREQGGFAVKFTALKNVEAQSISQWSRVVKTSWDPKALLYCGVKCRYFGDTKPKYLKKLELLRGTIEKGGYVYELKFNGEMKKDDEFVLHFDQVWAHHNNQTTYRPYVHYWPKDNEDYRDGAFIADEPFSL